MALRPERLRARLETFARVDLGARSSPIEPLTRLGRRLGIDLHVMRDDLFSLAMGGNKVRQLEYFLGPTVGTDFDTVLVSGAIQSNMVRLTAAAACRLGWQAIVQLEDRVPRADPTFHASGNVLLDTLFSADIHRVPAEWSEADAIQNLDRLADEARTRGRNPFVVQTSPNHPPLGALGYANAAIEIVDAMTLSERLPDHIVIASGSGISHVGILAGARAMGWQVPVHGVCVRRTAAEQRPRLKHRIADLSEMLEIDPPTDEDILINDQDFAPGYGIPNAAVRTAIRHAAKDEALILDPTYTGRAMAGLMSLVKDETIKQGERVLFIHTGGQPGLFAYAAEFAPALTEELAK
ncbi:MAG: D-cysteine desulfhydrase family protein [Pseudomonadota bacterium]